MLRNACHCLLRGIDGKASPRRFHIPLLLLLEAVLVTWLQHLLDQALPFGLFLDDLNVQGRDSGSLVGVKLWVCIAIPIRH